MKAFTLALAAVLTLAGVAAAQQATGAHGGHAIPSGSHAGRAPSQPSPVGSPATTAYEAVAARMHQAMAIPYTGDAGVDFLRGMIPHHRGAVDMARVALQHGKDPQVRKLAEEIVAAQQRDIADTEGHLRRFARSKGEVRSGSGGSGRRPSRPCGRADDGGAFGRRPGTFTHRLAATASEGTVFASGSADASRLRRMKLGGGVFGETLPARAQGPCARAST